MRALLPRPTDYQGLGRSWRGDLIAGLTVAVVALPLALGFGVTSGMGAGAGVITAVVAGVVAAVFGGSHVQVSGPTGAMTVVLIPIVVRYGRESVFVVGVLAGALVVVAAFSGVGRYLAYVPWPVIEGFTAGIAVIIFLQQVPAALGMRKPPGENTAVVAVRALARAVPSASASAIAIAAIVAAVMVVLPRLHRALPASLAAVTAGTVISEVAHLSVARIGALPTTLPTPDSRRSHSPNLGSFVGPALAVAALAAIESLLSARVADGMADGTRHDPDRELLGQGLANLIAPLFGGVPATGAIARTAVNVRAGARTRVAAVIHAVVLLAIVAFAAPVVSRIPLAALAGVLMVTAVRMIERHNIRAVVRATRSDAVVFGLTALATVVFDLIVAIEVGVAVAALLALRQVARTSTAIETPLPIEVDSDTEHRLLAERIVTYRLDGALFFGAAQRFLTELTNVAAVEVVILRMPDVQVLDATGAQALGEIVRELEDRHITVLLKGLRPEHRRILTAVGALRHLADERHVFAELEDAVAHAHLHAKRSRSNTV